MSWHYYCYIEPTKVSDFQLYPKDPLHGGDGGGNIVYTLDSIVV